MEIIQLNYLNFKNLLVLILQELKNINLTFKNSTV